MSENRLAVDCYTRVPLGLCPSRDLCGEPFATIDELFPAIPRLVAHWRRQLQDSRASNYRDIFSNKLLVSLDGGAPFSLDPQGATMFARQWSTFERLLHGCGVKFFDGLEPAPPIATAIETRFDFVCRVDPGPTLHIERTILTTAEGKAPEIFRALAGGGVPRSIETIPVYLLEEFRRDLEGKTRREEFEAPLMPLVKRAREVMERTIVANHFLYFELIDDIIQARAFDHPNTIPDILLSHLQGNAFGVTREELKKRIRKDFPGFDFHPTLAKVHFCAESAPPRPPQAIPPPPWPEPTPARAAPPDPPVEFQRVTYRHAPYGEDLAEILSYISASLQFYRWRVEGDIDHLGDAARFLIGQVPELQAEWGDGVPEPEPIDPAIFWESVSRNRSAASLRKALYDPPYPSAGPEQIARLEPRLLRLLFGDARPEEFAVYSFGTEGNSWFINEWWDYCWIAFSLRRREAIAIYGTATD
ncbi:MAG: hypothetical protein K8T20_16495 [Planctomycetes bacterium]|nr:hypothetical protein [Planctomycetota bacterium]